MLYTECNVFNSATTFGNTPITTKEQSNGTTLTIVITVDYGSSARICWAQIVLPTFCC